MLGKQAKNDCSLGRDVLCAALLSRLVARTVRMAKTGVEEHADVNQARHS